MKEETRFVAFNGACFNYKEDAEYYEKVIIAKTRKRQCHDICKEMMYRVHISHDRVKRLEERLTDLNTIIRHPDQFSEDTVIKSRAERFALRWEIGIERNLHITNKKVLHRYQRAFSEISRSLDTLEKQWEEVKAGRIFDNSSK